ANYNTGRPQGPADTLAPEGEMKESKRTRKPRRADVEPETTDRLEVGDIYAVGTAGGGTAIGGLAGTNIGSGEPDEAALEDAMASDEFDLHEARQEDEGRSPDRPSAPRKPR
ncbi:MAG TPA: hypothetical protein VGE52_03980, partial [Pirellulales bacterium]